MVGDSDVRPGGEHEPGRRHWFRRPRWIALMIVAAVAGRWGDSVRDRVVASGREGSLDRQGCRQVPQEPRTSTAGFLRPAPGVYTFVGTGTEKLSLLATTQHWGPRIPVTVTDDSNGCWTFRVDYSTHHWQSVRYCAKGRVLQQTGETTFQSFDFVAVKASDTNDTVCNPPIDRIRVDAKPGARWHVACDGRSKSRGTKFHAAGTDTFIGIEKLRVGSEAGSRVSLLRRSHRDREPVRPRALRHVVLGPRRTSAEDRSPR